MSIEELKNKLAAIEEGINDPDTEAEDRAFMEIALANGRKKLAEMEAAQAAQSKPTGTSPSIYREGIAPRTARQAYDTNKEIQELLGERANTDQPFTQADIKFINQYSGFGGLTKFDSSLNADQVLYEFYTPMPIVSKMIGLAKKYGMTEKWKVLEPSCGIGRFLHYFPPSMDVTGVEIDGNSRNIAALNFPNFRILQQSFNRFFVDRRGRAQNYRAEYDLIIGNPPYGAFQGKLTSVEKKKTKSNTYIDYFITRGLDLLKKDGLLIYIIPQSFLEGKMTTVKEEILRKADLIDAYRLPKDIFDRTAVMPDIVVFKKK